jgi:excisionase family DNA binding protein
VTTDPWPFPADTALARARRVAQSYRSALQLVDPVGCQRLDEQMIRFGQRWVAPTVVVYGDDDWLTAEQVADYAGVRLSTAYEWRTRGLPSVRTNEGVRFQFAAVRAWLGGHRGT